MKNITFDIESLGDRTSGPIVQIGAVKFTDEGVIEGEFLRSVKLESLERYNFKPSYDTIRWWFGQDDRAIKSVFCVESIDIRQALFEFLNWIGKHGDYLYWSHSIYDPPVLFYNLKKVGLSNPIPYDRYRDITTLTRLIAQEKIEFKGIKHNALDDCRHQASVISNALLLLDRK